MIKIKLCRETLLTNLINIKDPDLIQCDSLQMVDFQNGMGSMSIYMHCANLWTYMTESTIKCRLSIYDFINFFPDKDVKLLKLIFKQICGNKKYICMSDFVDFLLYLDYDDLENIMKSITCTHIPKKPLVKSQKEIIEYEVIKPEETENTTYNICVIT